jgi:hypothetical protein
MGVCVALTAPFVQSGISAQLTDQIQRLWSGPWATPTHQDCWWLEIDQATESLPRIKRKCRTYLNFLTHGGTGPNGIPPRILFSAPDPHRTQAINDVITKQTTTETEHLICATTHTDAPKFLITELTEP